MERRRHDRAGQALGAVNRSENIIDQIVQTDERRKTGRRKKMVVDRRHYNTKLESVIAEKAETIGLCRELEGYYEFVGYLHIKSEDGQKELYEITLRDENGYLGNAITKSENVVKQIDELLDVLEDEDEPRGNFAIGFRERKTKKGNNYIQVLCTTVNANRANAEQKTESED